MAGNEKIQVNDKGWAGICQLGTKYNFGKYASVGVQGAKAAAVEHKEADDMTNVELATIHEFGSSDGVIPERSFIRSTFDKHLGEYDRTLQTMGQQMFRGKKAEGALVMLGEKLRADIIMAIKNREIYQGLSDATKVRKKKESTALIDTGKLWNAISSVLLSSKPGGSGEGKIVSASETLAFTADDTEQGQNWFGVYSGDVQ